VLEENVMRRIWAGVLGIFLLSPVCAVAAPPKPAKDQVDEIGRAFQAEMDDLQKQFEAATTPEAKEKLRDKAINQVSLGFAKKMLAVAVAHPKDPAAADALVFVCAAPGSSQSPLVPEAVKLLLRDHAENDQLAIVSQAVQGRPDDEALIRSIRTGATNRLAKLQAGFFLAEVLREKDELTAEQSREAEKLYAEFVAAARGIRGMSPDMIRDAEAGLKDLRVFATGKPAPPTEGTDLTGNKVSLADYRGKVVVLDFWFTGCGPCVAMIPHEREMVKKYSGRPFALISVSADEKPADVTEFLKETPMPWAHWHSGMDTGVAAAWNVRGYPTIYVIDAKGIIRGRIVGGGPRAEKRLDELVAAAMKEAG
jgi:thiol-disulfide isomerase/thioredoxin